MSTSSYTHAPNLHAQAQGVNCLQKFELKQPARLVGQGTRLYPSQVPNKVVVVPH